MSEEAGEKSSKSNVASAVGGDPQPMDIVSRSKRMRDFIHLILSYPMRIGYEEILKRFIQEVDVRYFFVRDNVETLRYVNALVPHDITEEIINGGGSVKHVPHPILLLATHLALHQLTLTVTSHDVKIQNIWFSARDDAEKLTVMEHIQANSRISAAFDDLKIFDFNQIHGSAEREQKLRKLATSLRQTTKFLVLLVDGDGDQKVNPDMVSLPIERDSQNVVVFITTLSPHDELSEEVQLRIRTEDHLLPWEVFSKNVGSELLDSSTTIQEIAVRIVERCGGHLLAINLMAKSLKGVKDVHVWELALEKLCYCDREAIVNAFLFNIIWANVIPEMEQVRLMRCLKALKSQDSMMSDDPVWVVEDQLFACWFSEQLVDTNEEAKKILQNFMECSILMQFKDIQDRRILVPVDIKTISHAVGEGIPENLADGALASTISNLQVLNLSNTQLKNLYYYNPDRLGELNLEGCMLEKLPEAVFKLQNLEALRLDHCSQLLELPQQISELQNLETLSMEWCKRLETLPQEIGKLQKLKTLLLGHCSQLLELPQQITQLENLETLSLAWCKRLETLPQDIEKLQNLQTLDLRGTSFLQINENQEFINSDYWPFSAPRYHEHGYRGEEATYRSSKPRKVHWDKLVAQVKKEEKEGKLDDAGDPARRELRKSFHPVQDFYRLTRIRDFLHVILSYPMRIGYEDFLKQWINDVHQLRFTSDGPYFYYLEWVEDLLHDERPVRYVQAIIPEDTTTEITNNGGIFSTTPLKQVPQPILLLATHLALHQLTLTITSRDVKIQNIWFSARDDAEKRTVMEHIQANSQISEAFFDLKIIDFNQIDDEAKREEELRNLASSLRWNTKLLVLLVEGDGDKKINPDMVSLPIERNLRNVVVFITTLSPNDELSERVQLRIKIEDHLLPWEVFRKNVGSELLDSSTTIQEKAVQIVEKCGGHLLAINLMAKSLKGVKDVHVWDLALEKLCYRDREAIVNAFFFKIFCANVIPEREQVRLMRCLKALKSPDSMMSDDPVWVAEEDQLFASWFYEKLVDTNEEAKRILQNFMECSILMQFEDIQDRRILVPVDIKTILHALGEEIPENLADGTLASTISNLQVLNLSNTQLRDLYYMPDRLRELNLEGCMLETLPEAIFKLQKLEALRLDHCSQLLELPQQISELQNLKTLSLEWCKRLEALPQEIGKLQKLRTLLLGHCSQLLELPQQITQLENLDTLSLVWCKRLETLPQDIGKLENLWDLDLRGTSFLQINENQEFINSDYWPLSSSGCSYRRGEEATYRSSKRREVHWDSKPRKVVHWDKLAAQVKKEKEEGKLDDAALDKLFWDFCLDYDAGDYTKRALRMSFHPVQDLYKLTRILDFLHVVLSYPMRIGYEDFLKQWINDVHQLRFTSDGPYFYYLERVEDLLNDERPVRYVQAVIPEGITTEITNNVGIFSAETPLKQVPHPILLLATHLALHQLTLTITSDYVKTQNIWFSARDDAEKRTVMERIQANSRIREVFADFQIIDFNQIDDEAKRKEELSNLKSSLMWTPEFGSSLMRTTRPKKRMSSRSLVILVDGDGDKKVSPDMVSLPIERNLQKVVVFITTLSPNDELSEQMQLRIRTEDHFLPWEVFRKNVGSELLDSSTTIQEIAVRIVEKCGGHLLAINLMAKSLKGVKDVHVWELALEKLCYRDREVIVNAFLFNMIRANVTLKRGMFRTLRCLIVIKYKYWKKSDEGSSFFAPWFSEQLVDTEEEAKGIWQHFMECSVFLQFKSSRGPRILTPEDIKIILQALGEEISENLSEEAFVSTISDLRVLDLSNTNLRNLYYVSPPRSAELNLEGSMLETLPQAIFKLHTLKTLSLEHCSQLLELPPLITKLHNLRELRLSGCKRLQTLPHEIWELPNLKTLSLPRTSIFPTSDNQDLINSDNLPPSSFQCHGHSGRGKTHISSSNSAIIQDGFTLKLNFHRRVMQFEEFCQHIMQLQIQNLENCDLSGTQITDLPEFLNFPNLRRLWLGSNLNLMKIPYNIFEHMPLLSTVNLSHTSIHVLPSSIFDLQQLKELYLKDCKLFGELSPKIGRLSNLTTLDLEGTLITRVPEEVGMLRNLESLSLALFSDGNHDSIFEVNLLHVLDGLKNLKVLRIGVNSDNEWWFKQFESILKKINGLRELQELDMYIPDVKFSAPIKDGLSNFRFIMGYHKPRMISRVPPAIEVMFKESSPSLKFVNGQDFPDKVKTILSAAWAFFLDRHMKINNLTQFGLKNLKQVRLCILAECNQMQSIVDVDEYDDLNESFCMQFLTIFYMKNLRSITNKPIRGSSIFCELKLLALHTCPELTTIFTVDSLHSLVNLEELIVEDCPKVTSIISCPSFDPTTDFFLPRLKKMSLLFVPELASISVGVRIGRNLEQMGFYYCPKLHSLSPAELSSEKLKVIKGETEWWEALQWSEEDWGQEDPAQKFNQKFSPFDERHDILTQMIPYELMTSFNKENDSGNNINSCLIPMTNMSTSTAMEEVMEDRDTTNVLNAKEDRYGGVIVNVEEPMDSKVFASLLQSSLSSWREQGKKGVWIKLPIGLANLVETVVKAGFRYHHAEADYLMLVRWISDGTDTIPANASHRVGIGAFVVNNNREVLVVREASGSFKGTGVWKLPTGTVEEGEDICDAAVREVKEEAGIETEFVEVLAFRQSHKAFFQKSDMFFVCMLQARSFDIQMQTTEIVSAQWMPFEDYAAQPFVKQTSGFDSVAKICLEKLNGNYIGFSPLPIITSSGKNTYLYFNVGSSFGPHWRPKVSGGKSEKERTRREEAAQSSSS